MVFVAKYNARSSFTLNIFQIGLLGKVLMEDIRAKEPYPPFAASVKDGYAVIGMCACDKIDKFFGMLSL